MSTNTKSISNPKLKLEILTTEEVRKILTEHRPKALESKISAEMAKLLIWLRNKNEPPPQQYRDV